MPRPKRQKVNGNGTDGANNMAHAWSDLPSILSDALPKANKAAQNDGQLKAFADTRAITAPVTFGIKSGRASNAILVTVSDQKVQIHSGSDKNCEFVLCALPEQWQEFMKQTPVMPYQSYWGMFGMNIKQEGIKVEGDQESFSRWTHIWRRVLELIHDAHSGPTPTIDDNEMDVDHITGKYVYINAGPLWGKCKVFYEQSGNGPQDIVFLHTAGSDSRQYHGVMNDERMMSACRMIAFDLPAHGRSFPYEGYWPGTHTNTEDGYVACIAAMVKKLNLNKPIICGASMAGQISLACAIRYKEVGCCGTIPLQGSDYLTMDRQWNDRSPFVNQALYNPEWIYGMIGPQSPIKNKQLIWHLYSAQAYGIFHGDLDMYFGGWDGRSRMKDIKCPVYMLTGEYDWSNTPEMAQKTCDKIPGGMHKAMKGLGHFPATENSKLFVPYLLEAIDHIHKNKE